MRKFFTLFIIATAYLFSTTPTFAVDYYVLNEPTTNELKLASGTVASYTWSSLAKTNQNVSFSAKTSLATTSNAKNITLQQTLDGSSWSDVQTFSLSTSYKTFTCTSLSKNAVGIRFQVGGIYTRSVKNVLVGMGSNLDAPSATSLDFGTSQVNDAATVRTFTVAWCNVPALSCSVSGEGSACVSVDITNNAEAGKYNTATITVTYNHTQASTLDAVLTLSDSFNGYSKTIPLTGSCSKRPQSIAWNESEVNLNISVEEANRDISGYVTSSTANVPHFTSSNEAVLRVIDGHIIEPLKAGSAEITAHIDEDAVYVAAASTSKTFTVSERSTPKYTVNTSYDLLVGESFTVLSTSPINMTCERVSGSTDGIYSFSNGVLTALREGSVVLNFKQTFSDLWYAGETGNVTVNISRHTTALSVNTSAHTLLVGETYNPAFTTNNSEVTPSFTSSNPSVAIYEDGVIHALAAGTATLTFAQSQTDKWTGASQTITVTVNKHNPNLHATNIPATNWNTTITPAFATENTVSEILLSQLDGEASAKLIDGNIVVYNVEGTAHFRVTQAATDYYTAAQYDFDLVVAHASNHVTVVLGSADLGGGGGGFNWDDKTKDYQFTGIPSYVTFRYANTSNASTGSSWKLQESANGSAWTNVWTSTRCDEGYENVTTSLLSPSSKYIRLVYSGNFGGKFRDVTVHERSEVLADNYDFGTFGVGATATARAIQMKWYNVPALTITSSNPSVFEVTTPTIAAGIDAFDENASIGITYHHNVVSPAAGDEATITIRSANGAINQTFKVTGKTVKKTQTLVWQDGISPMSVGKTHINPASAALPLNYEVISGSAVEILNGNQIHAVAAGSATVRAYNDGDDTWNPVSGTFDFSVTELKVQRIHWAQTFSRLRTTSDDIALNAEVFVVLAETEEKIDRTITYTSSNPAIVTIIDGNVLHVVGAGTAIVTAHVDGDAEYIEDNLARTITVREPSEGCEMFVLENASDKLFTIDSKELTLSGEPAAITFDAWSSKWGLVSPSSSPMRLAEYYDGAWHEIWQNELKVDQQQSFGPIALHRNATKIKFYTETGATCYHSFSSAYVTLADYLEFTDAPAETAQSVVFPAAETQIGQTYTKTVAIRYSNIFDQLSVTHSNAKFQVVPESIGTECGDHGTATISISFHAENEGTETDVITITDGHKSLSINLSATTQRNDQTITFTPAESILTTDVVTLSATASSALPVVFEQVSGAEFATVNAAGEVTILQGGGSIVVRATQPGSSLYNAAPSVEKTISINKVTPTITTAPSVAELTLPTTLAAATIDNASAVVTNDKSATISGSFAWIDETTSVVSGTNSYSAIFIPTNTNYYTTATCELSVTASRLAQTITWSLTDNSEFHYFQSVPLNAVATSGLSITYTSSDESVAQIAAGAVQFIAPGTVTITATQSGNATYEAAAPVARTISIVKATPAITTIPSLVTFYQGHSLSESPILGGVATVDGNVVEGTFSWKEDATPEVGDDYTFPAIFTPANTDFFNTAECDVPVRVTVYERVFTDATGNHLWSDPLNWTNGFVPESVADATITGPVIINTSVSIDELTIEENAEVLVIENGSLTVDHSGTSGNGRYGDLYVKDAASVTFNGDFQLRNLYLSSVLDSYNGHSKSAQVSNPNNLRMDGDVYFDLQIDASGECSPGWYDFTVPFPVDALNGVYRMENGVQTKVTNERNYAIMSYNESLRAQGQYGWKKFRGIMQPGICYSITIDDVYPVYRFRKTKDGALNTNNTLPMSCTTGVGEAVDQGWNSLGNGTLRHADLSAYEIDKVQVYDHATNSYSVVSMSDCSFVVGSAFFVQATPAASSLTLNPADPSHTLLRAPAATRSYSDEHSIILTREGGDAVLDRLYLSATEEDKSSYLPGHDLAKFETSTSTPQMWCSAYGVKLCDAELPLVDNTVDFPLSISAPSSATYTLSVSRMVENETLYLVQDGVIIWNLSDADYTFDLAKGTNSSYSVRLIRRISQVTTDMEQLHDSATADKFLMNGALYILRDGKMYDALGHRVK